MVATRGGDGEGTGGLSQVFGANTLEHSYRSFTRLPFYPVYYNDSFRYITQNAVTVVTNRKFAKSNVQINENISSEKRRE